MHLIKKWIAKILAALKNFACLPEREGKEHLHRNYHTFDACLQIFKKNGIVLIFTEALCENEWHLRPLKKGSARLAATAWEKGIPLKVLPIGLNYSSFRLFGKNVHLHIGLPIARKQLKSSVYEDGKLLNEVTENVETQLKAMVYEIDAADKKKQAEIFKTPIPLLQKTVLTIPAILGFITHCFFILATTKNRLEKSCSHGAF
jgi:1-acyl-sn-glycerol-3-phosphate acyltransferase